MMKFLKFILITNSFLLFSLSVVYASSLPTNDPFYSLPKQKKISSIPGTNTESQSISSCPKKIENADSHVLFHYISESKKLHEIKLIGVILQEHTFATIWLDGKTLNISYSGDYIAKSHWEITRITPKSIELKNCWKQIKTIQL